MMAEQWYFQLEGESVGPIDAAQLQALARRGRLTPETLVRPATNKGWVPAGKVTGLKFLAPSEPAPTPAKNPSSTTMRAPAALKKAKLLEPGVSPAQIQRMSDSHAMAAGIVPPPLPVNSPPGHSSDQYFDASPAPPNYDVSQIPSGIPVGVPIGAASPPTGPAPYAPQTRSPTPWINVNATQAATPSVARGIGEERTASDRKLAARRKLYWMVGGVAGVVLALGVIGAILAVNGARSNAEKGPPVARKGLDEELAEASAATTSSGEAGQAGETTDVAEDSPAGKTQAASSDAKAARATNSASTASDTAARSAAKGSAPGDLASAIKSVGRWFDLAKSSAVSSKTMKLQLAGAWLDEGGSSGKSTDENEPITAKPTASRLFLELRITNSQTDAPLNYAPWNGDGTGSGMSLAMLATSDGHSCPFVPVSRTNEPSRLKAPVRIKPGQTITEMLVFEAPSEDYEVLQLLLPTSAIGQAGRYLGLKIPRELVATQKPVELAQDAPPSRTAPVATSEAPAASAPAKTIANSEPAPAPKPRDENIDDLRKSIIDSVKEKQKEKDEAVTKEREANKKKSD